jgi:hypothetical protein
MTVPALAQAVYTGQTAFQNLAMSQSGEHVPGRMVGNGLARAQSAVRDPAAPFEITDDQRYGIAYELRIEAVTTVLGEALDFWNFLVVQYLQREGFDVDLPDDSDSPDDGDDGSGRDDSRDDGGKGDTRKVTASPRTAFSRPTD